MNNEDFAGTRAHPQKKVECPTCHGSGTEKRWNPKRNRGHLLRSLVRPRTIKCTTCNGKKRVYAAFVMLMDLTE